MKLKTSSDHSKVAYYSFVDWYVNLDVDYHQLVTE